MTHILHSEGGVLVLRVDPDDPVTQPRHGEHSPGRKRGTGNSRSAHIHTSLSHNINIVLSRGSHHHRFVFTVDDFVFAGSASFPPKHMKPLDL